ncbi:MAG: hypothetical protein WBC91_14955, partial [Phototrophicaceae bacterium]
MATTNYNDDVIIEGSQDEVQLIVKGNSTQTAALQEWQDSNDNEVAKITTDGRFQSGDIGLSSDDALIEAHRDEPSPLPKRGIHSLGRVAGILTTAIAWLVGELELIGTATISSLHTAIRGRLTHSSTGDSSNAEVRAGDFEAINTADNASTPLGKAVGLQGTVSNHQDADLTHASAVVAQVQNALNADMDTAIALEVATPINDGTINTLIGLDIPDIDQGTNNYAIRTGVGIIHLGDVVDVVEQATDPADKAGVVQVYAKGDRLYAKAPDPDNTVY